MQTDTEDPLTYWDWLTTPCEYCGLALAYCSCAEGDEPGKSTSEKIAG